MDEKKKKARAGGFMMECPNREKNMEMCNCSYASCGRKGMCCECLHYHRKNGQLPACFFQEDAEITYDRSVEKFIEVNS